MSKVKYISSPNDIPAGQQYVLVVYGKEHAQTKHPLGLTIAVASTVSQLSFLTAIHAAKGIAKNAGISEVFVCAPRCHGGSSPTRGDLLLQDELYSDAIWQASLTVRLRSRPQKERAPPG